MKSQTACLCVVLSLLLDWHGSSEVHAIDPDRSVISIRVLKSGFFSAFAHNHDVQAKGVTGQFRTAENLGVEFRLNTRNIKVLDPEESVKNRAEIQQTMEGPKVLDIARFPEILFKSTAVTPTGPGTWTVSGELTLHGQTRPVVVHVLGNNNGRYTGEASLKQTDFGIQPISLFGGTVKVKDELKISFDIYTGR